MQEKDLFPIGRIGKPHGVHGELTFIFDDDVFDRVDADYLFLRVDGLMVPFFFEEYRFRSDTTALVKFEGIDSVERARELTGCDVFLPRHLADGDEIPLSLQSLVGFSINEADTGRSIGTIDAIDDQTANILFCMDDGRLIPANDNLVTGIDQQARTITMRLPDGLLDL